MRNATEKFKRIEQLLQCPLCGKALRVDGNSLRCGGGHCYDISAKGYVNFRPAQKKTIYDTGLFLARRNVLESGLYDCVVGAARKELENAREEAVMLDAGSGEGFFMRRLAKAGCRHVAADIEKEAIKLAAKGGGDIGWMVADIAGLPLARKSVDIVINILSPANYAEFNRVLKETGIVIKVVPGEGHLKELRQMIDIEHADYRNDDVIEHFMQNTSFISVKRVTERKQVEANRREDFFDMTPLTRNVDIGRTELRDLDTVTVDFEVLVGGKKRQ